MTTTTSTSSLLRLVTCGSVDDGKSTLIGRLLYDAKGIFEDQLAAVEKATTRYGTTGGTIDLALLTDGLKAEREQGITIDVAYRYFSTPKRPFIIADCPGHEQYTRNMATGASTADVAILLIDARHGVVTQTRRHAYIVSLLGIKHVVLAVNKMDLVNWSKDTFAQIVKTFEAANATIGLPSVHAIPMSALNGDNVTGPSTQTPWYSGPYLLEHLESISAVDPDVESRPFRFPVQLVSRPNSNFRGYQGEVVSGHVKPGDEIIVLPAGVTTKVTSVFDADGPAASVKTLDAATITLATEVDASRGDIIASAAHRPIVANKLLANLVWFSTDNLSLGSLYRLKHSTRLTTGLVTKIRHRVNVNTLEHLPAETLNVNDIALCEIEAARPLVFDPYTQNRSTGSFILIDRITGNTVAAGMIVSDISTDLASGPVTALERATRLGQRPVTITLTGDASAARETATALDRLLFTSGNLSAILDASNFPSLATLELAVKSITNAGLITLIITPPNAPALPKSPHTAHATATSNPHDLAKSLLTSLRSAQHLTAPTTDFEI